MKLTSIDIKQQQFKKVCLGFNPREVELFLEIVAENLSTLSRENQDLRQELTRCTRDLEEYRLRENSLQQAMLTAKQAIDEMREQAQKEAKLLLSEAELRAEKILHEAYKKAGTVVDDLKELQRQRTRFIEDLRSTLKTHDKLLDLLVESDQLTKQDLEAAAMSNVTNIDKLRAR